MSKGQEYTDQEILDWFLEEWPLDRVASMTLNEYTGLANQDTFTYWVENRTKKLGSIKGLNSIQFGVYRRGDDSKDPKRNSTDGTYIWRKRLNAESSNDAFDLVKTKVLEVIKLSIEGRYEEIERIDLYNMYKWKIAFLYSDQAFVPIFKKESLFEISRTLGMVHNRDTKIFEIHDFILDTKPYKLNVFQYMRELLNIDGEPEPSKRQSSAGKRKTRSGVSHVSDEIYTRKSISRKVIVNQYHKSLQNQLVEILKVQYPDSSPILEENYIDVKVDLYDRVHYYEVKIERNVESCIRQGLGQLLSYVYHENDPRKKKLFICGQSKPTPNDIGFIEYLKGELVGFDFDYLPIELKE